MRCVECLNNSDCKPGLCNTTANTCIQGCSTDNDCPVTTIKCHNALDLCVECLTSADCDTGVCEPSSNRCVGCYLDSDCLIGNVCDLSTHTCITSGCTTSNTCADPRYVCDPTRDYCVDCMTDSDCSNPQPACDSATGVCVECTNVGHCGSANPYCDSASQTCVACEADTNCTNQVCHPSTHSCVECAGNNDCALGWMCDPIAFSCFVTTYCGNSLLDTTEGCDDGNNVDGDGCNDVCLIENNYDCNTNAAGMIGNRSCASEFCDERSGSPGNCRVKLVEPGGNFVDPTTDDDDDDGLPYNEEINLGSDPENPDSDGGGLNDGEEIAAGRDPNSRIDDSIGVSGGQLLGFGCQTFARGQTFTTLVFLLGLRAYRLFRRRLTLLSPKR